MRNHITKIFTRAYQYAILIGAFEKKIKSRLEQFRVFDYETSLSEVNGLVLLAFYVHSDKTR